MKEVFYTEKSNAEKAIFDYNPMSMSIMSNVGELKGQAFRYFTYNGQEGYESRNPEDWDWAFGIWEEFLQYDQRPWFVINGMTPILCELPFSQADLERLRSEPVAIYLYESLSFSAKQGRAYELDRICEFKEKYKIERPIIVYTCERNYGDYARKHGAYPELDFRTFDLYLAHASNFRPPSACYSPTLPKPLKKFICLNYRYEAFREVLAGMLMSYDSEDMCYLSFYHRHNHQYFLDRLGFGSEQLNRHEQVSVGINKMQPQLPISPDAIHLKGLDPEHVGTPDLGTGANRRSDEGINSYYCSSIIVIAAETSFHLEAAGISEKTIAAIEMKRPFIVVSGPGALAYLQELGFKTFANFWDESYDQELDPAKRMNKVLDLVDSLATRSMDELKEMYWEMSEILEHNARVWFSLFEERSRQFNKKDSAGSLTEQKALGIEAR